MGVAARHGVDGPTHVDVVFVAVGDVGQVDDLPVTGGTGQAGGRETQVRTMD